MKKCLAGARALALAAMPLSAMPVSAMPVSAIFVAAQAAPSTPAALAAQTLRLMTQAQKLAIVDGKYANAIPPLVTPPPGAVGSAGFVASPGNLGIANLQESDAGIGVADPATGVLSSAGVVFNGPPIRGTAGYSVALPSTLGVAASFDPGIAFAGGAMIGGEAHREGFNVLLAGSMDLVREPRGGRTFIYPGEDPLLAGVMAGAQVRGVQSRHVMSTVKHFALNAQETGRMVLSADIGEADFRQSDLLAFEFAIEQGHPAAVMCAYNRINAVYACGNDFLLNQVLKHDWHYGGWVMSDWGAVHALSDITAGLDQESADIVDLFTNGTAYFQGLGAAITAGSVPESVLNAAVLRILAGGYATGAWADPPVITPIDAAADTAVSRLAEEQAIVLLQNTGGVLPLPKTLRHVLVVGGNAVNGVLEGSGSEQVQPVGGPAAPIDAGTTAPHPIVWLPSPPVAAIQAELPGASVVYTDGGDIPAAAALARGADAVIVFATQPMGEGWDAPDLSLPADPLTGGSQDALIAAMAAANPRTIVVLETGGPVKMPWLAATPAVLEAWYPGAGGGPAIAHVLFGDTDAAGRLPVTFPQSEAQLPRPVLDGTANPAAPFDVNYGIEGASVGYKWFIRRGFTPLFAFGHGLSFTNFAYTGLRLTGGAALSVEVTVTNTGRRAGYAVPQAYVRLPAAVTDDPVRLIGWRKLFLRPGQSARARMALDPRLLATFDPLAQCWRVPAGPVLVSVGASALDERLGGTVSLAGGTLPP